MSGRDAEAACSFRERYAAGFEGAASRMTIGDRKPERERHRSAIGEHRIADELDPGLGGGKNADLWPGRPAR